MSRRKHPDRWINDEPAFFFFLHIYCCYSWKLNSVFCLFFFLFHWKSRLRLWPGSYSMLFYRAVKNTRWTKTRNKSSFIWVMSDIYLHFFLILHIYTSMVWIIILLNTLLSLFCFTEKTLCTVQTEFFYNCEIAVNRCKQFIKVLNPSGWIGNWAKWAAVAGPWTPSCPKSLFTVSNNEFMEKNTKHDLYLPMSTIQTKTDV